ncbi:MBL fold metallo-hydrolase [Planctomycetota bacterium]
MPSHKLSELELANLHIMGYSVAGEETVVAVPSLDVCFDVGKAPDQIISINHVLLTHGHMDHAAGIAYYLSHRNFDGQAPGTILAPKNIIAPIQQIVDAWGRLDGNRVPGKLVGMEPGDEYKVKSNLIARAFATVHCRGSLGYTVLEKRKKLKPEYTQLTGPQIVELKRQGIAIENPIEIPLVTYLGDTQYTADYAQCDDVANSKILIAECTFYEEEHLERSQAGRHLHVRDFARLTAELNNDHIVLIHATQRTGMREIKQMLRKHLSQDVQDKLVLLMDRRHQGRA